MKLKVPDMKEGEKRVAELTDELRACFSELEELGAEGLVLIDKLTKLKSKLDAKRSLFWSDVEALNERCETADSRGKVLSLRRDGGKLVVIEEIAPTDPLSSLRQILGLGS